MKDHKHDHKLTTKLKTCLFTIVMIMPFLAIGATTLYVALNKNAMESYEGDYTFTETYQETTNTMKKDTLYYSDTFNILVENTQMQNVKEASITFDEIEYKTTNYENYDSFKITLNTSAFQIDGINNETATRIVRVSYSPQGSKPIRFNYLIFKEDTAISQNYRYRLKADRFVYDNTLSAVFYAQTNRVWQAPLFNWVMKGPFYVGMTAFTSIFGIPNQTFFSNLLVYWTTMVCIYVIFDIVIDVFVFITHAIKPKESE